ncbi:MAG: Gfo/Idh/MocA family protein [Christensenellales bacterium]|jgi:predicted dehydrogenase
MEKIRVGIIGAGNIAQSAHLPVYQERDDVEVVAIADWSLERAQEAAKKFGIPKAYANVEELLANEDVDYVDICVWNRSHAPVAIAAAKAGKHVLCEKPMAIDLSDALEMEKVIRETGVTFMLAVPTRYLAEAQLLNQMRKDGKLGDIYYAKTANVRRRGTPIGWFTDTKKSGGGPVIDIGVHCIDRTWYLMGRPRPVRVSANTAYRIGDFKTKGVKRWEALDSDVTAFDTEDSAAGVIHFENGAVMLFEVSWALNAPPTEYTQICGTKAGATLDPLVIYGEDMDYLTDNKPTVIDVNPFAVEIDHFIHCLRTGETPESPLADGVTVQRMLQGIYDSARLGREVEI